VRGVSFVLSKMMSTEQVDIILLASEDREALCYLCLDGGVDEAGQQVRRDCACPGTDAGFVHLSCLTNYAIAKNKGWGWS
jgi:hypothetical protein